MPRSRKYFAEGLVHRAVTARAAAGGEVLRGMQQGGASRASAAEVTCPGTNVSAPLPVTCPRVAPSTEDGRKRHCVPPRGWQPYSSFCCSIAHLYLIHHPISPEDAFLSLLPMFLLPPGVLFQFTSASDILICMFFRLHLILLPAMLLF